MTCDSCDGSQLSTIGVLEMGGASMQVSFVPSDLSAVDAAELVNVKIGGATFPLYTHSYLNYGLEQAQVIFSHLFAVSFLTA